jgi:membrane-associated tyrosine/threonine-specific cdc2-inhibitory kinase
MDVKPDNIFLTIDAPTIYKLGDFGIVVCLEEKKDVVEFIEGDSRYLAPEVMQGTISTKADVFSLGLTLLEVACTVDLPKGGELWHSLRNGELPDPCPREMPESLRKIIEWMLTPDVGKRPEISDLMEVPEITARIERRRRKLRMEVDVMEVDQSRATPEPFTNVEKEIPSIVLNDHSFSDDEEMRDGGTPVFASTPISLTRSGGRLRSSKRNAAEGEFRAMGSPTSRNLLKEFEAVSD